MCVCVCVRIYELYWKSIKTEALFTKIEMNNEWNVKFLKNCPFGIQYIYSIEFSFRGSTSESFLSYGEKQCFRIF